MHARSLIALTALAFGIYAGPINAQSRDARNDWSQQQSRSNWQQPPAYGQRYANRSYSYRPAYQRERGRGAGPDRRYYKGDRLSAYQRSRPYIINDWRVYRLYAPPRGYHWVRLGPDFVLAAIATGVITQVVFGY